MSERQTIRALLVEDDEGDAAIFRRYAERLRDYDLEITRADTGRQAGQRIKERDFDFVFIDLELGGAEDGLELLARMERFDLSAPAVVVTGSGDEAKAVEAMKAGAYDYLVKDDLNTDLLERTIRNVRHRYELEKERKRMMTELAELSVTDELTGLANRRRLDRKLEDEVARSGRTGQIFAVLMIDLDHFKQVNDRHGHQAGDEVLVKCGKALKASARSTDFVARFGGEEFCMLLPDTPPRGGRRAGERAREAVEKLPAPVPTTSVGVAYWEPRISGEEIIRRADEALYRAKESGRNRVVVYGEEHDKDNGR